MSHCIATISHCIATISQKITTMWKKHVTISQKITTMWKKHITIPQKITEKRKKHMEISFPNGNLTFLYGNMKKQTEISQSITEMKEKLTGISHFQMEMWKKQIEISQSITGMWETLMQIDSIMEIGMPVDDWLLFASVAADIRIAAGCFLFVTYYEERGKKSMGFCNAITAMSLANTQGYLGDIAGKGSSPE